MQDNRQSGPTLKAQLLRDQKDVPVQFVMSASEAADLAFITGDFAREVVPNCDEARKLIEFAAQIAIRVEDCLAARASLVPTRKSNGANAPRQVAFADVA